MVLLKRIYEPAAKDDGFRILVERLWPRGFTKERAHIDLWLKDVAPRPTLRAWYGHDVNKWNEFKRRYTAELRKNPAVLQLRQLLKRHKTVTFVFASRDEEHNSATVLKSFVEN
jgi:uncharacterized protein YeaO (DUF488 family)